MVVTILDVKINNKKLRIKDCRGISSIRGLMFNSMETIDGALIYTNKIWMPFVRHKLDLLFLDKGFRLIERQLAVPLSLNPKTWKSYKCKKARYCLEVRAGLIDTREGMKIIYRGQL